MFVAESLATALALLARVAGFELIFQSSSFAFRNRQASIATIARDLSVRYIVEGSVRGVGDVVRVSTRLIAAASMLGMSQLNQRHFRRAGNSAIDTRQNFVGPVGSA